MKAMPFVLALVVASGLTGCSSVLSKQADVTGKWNGKISLTPEQQKSPAAAMMKSMTPTLELKKDNTFAMTMVFPIEGTWAMASNKLSLTMTKMMGMSIDDIKKQAAKSGQANSSEMDKPMVFDVSADGKTLTAVDNKSTAGGSLTFTKEGA
jgi:hypothetical protein